MAVVSIQRLVQTREYAWERSKQKTFWRKDEDDINGRRVKQLQQQQRVTPDKHEINQVSSRKSRVSRRASRHALLKHVNLQLA